MQQTKRWCVDARVKLDEGRVLECFQHLDFADDVLQVAFCQFGHVDLGRGNGARVSTTTKTCTQAMADTDKQ